MLEPLATNLHLLLILCEPPECPMKGRHSNWMRTFGEEQDKSLRSELTLGSLGWGGRTAGSLQNCHWPVGKCSQRGQDLRLAPIPLASTSSATSITPDIQRTWRVVAGLLREIEIGGGDAEQEDDIRPALKEETRIQRWQGTTKAKGDQEKLP